ncbi:MAG: helix-turn-helix domain-containing protein [Bacteroidales bacterium]|nr:helix-turn-helix domain-containing protein [Bacteroidales bacterium]
MAGSKIPIRKVCEHCGGEVKAQKVSTRFCSHTCANRAYKQRKREERVQNTEVETQKAIREQPVAHLKDRPYLSVADTAALLGLTVQGVYKQIYSGRLRASKLSSRLTVIRREDIEWMLAEDLISEYQERKRLFLNFIVQRKFVSFIRSHALRSSGLARGKTSPELTTEDELIGAKSILMLTLLRVSLTPILQNGVQRMRLKSDLG